MKIFSNNNTHLVCKSKKFIAANSVFSDTDQLMMKQGLDIPLNVHQNKRTQTHRHVIRVDMYEEKHGKYGDSHILLTEAVKIKEITPCVYPQIHLVESVKYVQKKTTKQKQKSRLPLVLSAGIATTLIISSIFALPNPFNYIVAIAICGPLSASLLGLRK